MESNPTWTPVAALALIDAEARILLQKRPEDRHHGGLWEFPGGKVEPGENPREALCREVAEELALAIRPADLAPALMADQEGAVPVVLFLYTCRSWAGEVVPEEGQEWGWFSINEAHALPMPPMDTDLLARIVL